MLAEQIKGAYGLRNADFLTRVRLQDDSDGKGPYIAKWDVAGEKKPDIKALPDVEEKAEADPVELLRVFLRANPSILESLMAGAHEA